MLFSNTAIRRYTPPTCTLKIAGKTSPLSRWGSRPLFEDLQFELRFDDPRKLKDEQVILQGDRSQLELLCEAVSAYTQDLLRHSAPQHLSPTLSLPTALLDPSPQAVPAAISEPLVLPSLKAETEPEKKLLLPDPHLKSKGLLAHQLFLGNLATEESGASLQLSALQLFDLATALEEYSADIAALPNFKSSQPRNRLVAWGSAAAGVVLAAGLSAAIFQVLNPSPTGELTASVEEQESAADKHKPLATLPLPSPPVGTPVPSPAIPPAISQGKQLPPPPPVSGPPPSGPVAPPIVVRPGSRNSSSTATAPPRRSQNQQSQPLPPEPQVPVQSAPAPAPAATPPPVASAPTATPNLPNLPAPGSQSLERSTASVPESVSAPSDISEALRGNGNVAARDRAVENIPQVAEVQSYFQQRWQPPESLTETLVYRLSLNRNGTIQRIIPQGQAAGRYLDRTSMPLLNESFGISPLGIEGTPRVRLSLHPDGQVEAYLESVE